MKNLIYLVMLILCSCKTKQCQNLNNKLINKFNANLLIVENAQNPKLIIKVDEYRAALLYLSNTTKILTKSDYSSTIGYEKRTDYKTDMKKWKDWLKKNSCLDNEIVSKTSVDSDN